MPINFPKFDTLDYGAAVQSGQQITENRIRNQMLGVAQQEQQNIIRNRQKAEDIRRTIDETPDQIRELEKAGLFDQADQLRDSYVQQQELGLKLIKSQRAGINKDNYKVWREQMIKGGTMPYWMLPEEYSEEWFAEKETEAEMRISTISVRSGDQQRDFVVKGGKIIFKGEGYDADDPDKGPTKVLTTTFTDPNTKVVMMQDFHYVNGEEVPAGPAYPASERSGGKPWQMTPEQLNGIKKSVAEIFEGKYDSISGEYQLPEAREAERKHISGLVREAEKTYKNAKGQIGMHEAAMQAIEKAGLKIPFPDLTDPDKVRENEDDAGGGPSKPLG